ncbi:MAG: hypothetical protein IPP30_02895 [Flavobacterium sp.]|nr:hypothetical protein [Flavobacterium sp.]
MKFKIFPIVLILVSCFSSAQTIENLKIATKKIYDANYTMDFDGVANLTYPTIVEHFGRTKFLDKLDNDYQNEKYRMRIQLEKMVFQYGEIQKIENKTYCVITYRNPARYFYETKLDSNTSLIEANFLREKDQTKDVTFEPKRNSFNVRRISKLIAIADASTGNEWKFINMDDVEQRLQSKNILDETVKKQLGL